MVMFLTVVLMVLAVTATIAAYEDEFKSRWVWATGAFLAYLALFLVAVPSL